MTATMREEREGGETDHQDQNVARPACASLRQAVLVSANIVHYSFVFVLETSHFTFYLPHLIKSKVTKRVGASSAT